MSENIVSLNVFKAKRELCLEKKEIQIIKEYYATLDFHGLINETHNLIQELDSQELDLKIIDRATTLLREYENRCHSNSSQMLKTLKSMREKIESRIQNIAFIN